MKYDGVETRELPEIRRKRAIFLPKPTPEQLRDALDALCAVPDVNITSHDGSELPTVKDAPRWGSNYDGMIQYIHKVKDGRDFYLLANSSDVPVSLDVQLRGSFKTLEIWNPLDGSISQIPPEKLELSDGCVCVKGMELTPVQALFLVGTH